MENLPDHLIIEILSRLHDSTELSRCRCVSKTLNTFARQVRSIHLYCSLDRYTKMRLPDCKVTPVKSIFHKLISAAEVPIESVSLGIEESFYSFDDYVYTFEEKCDDLFLCGGSFSEGWMTTIGHGLKSISISTFWPQSHAKETNILEVISHNCHSLVELTLQSACLTVDDMHLMPLLTRLTLNYVTISEMHVNKLMECLPCLQVLILVAIRVEHPKIHHSNLKELKWTLFDCYEDSSVESLTIFAPNLSKLELICGGDPIKLFISTPLLSYFHLALDSAEEINAEQFKTLKKVSLVSGVSRVLHDILSTFPSSKTVEDLTINSSKSYDPPPLDELINFSDVLAVFPNVTKLTLGYEFWSQEMFYSSDTSACTADTNSLRGLKQITIYLLLVDIVKALTFILYVIKICPNLTDMVLFIPCDVDLSVASSFVSLCKSMCPKVRCRRGT